MYLFGNIFSNSRYFVVSNTSIIDRIQQVQGDARPRTRFKHARLTLRTTCTQNTDLPLRALIIHSSNARIRSDYHEIQTEEINPIKYTPSAAYLSLRVLITRSRVNSERLMWPPSWRRTPSLPVSRTRSETAKSTRLSVDDRTALSSLFFCDSGSNKHNRGAA